MRKHITYFEDFYSAYKQMLSNQFGGFVVISSGSYYVQMTPTYDIKNKRIDGECVVVEAASHRYIQFMPDFTKEFEKLGLQLDKQGGNFSCTCYVKAFTFEEIKVLIKEIFSIYGVEVPPFDLELKLFDKIPDRSNLTSTPINIQGIQLLNNLVYNEVIEIKCGQHLYAVKSMGKWGCLNENLQLIAPFVYDEFGLYGNYNFDDHENIEPRFLVIKDNLCGLLDKNWNEIVTCQYELIMPFNEGVALVKRNNKFGYIDIDGNRIIPFQYDEASVFSEGKAWVMNSVFNGFINPHGVILKCNCNYDRVYPFQGGHAVVVINNKNGIIDESFNLIVKPISKEIQLRNGCYEIIDSAWEIEATYTYDGVEIDDRSVLYESQQINDSFRFYVRKHKYGITNKNGVVLLPPIYTQYRFIENTTSICIIFSRDESSILCCVDNNDLKLSKEYDEIDNILGDVFKTFSNGKYGLLNSNCIELLPCEYEVIHGNGSQYDLDYTTPSSYYCLTKNGKVGLLDGHLNIILDFIYEWIHVAKIATPYFIVHKNGKEYIFNALTRKFGTIGFDHIQYFGSDNYSKATLSGANLIINLDGEIVVNNEYELIERFSEGLAKVKKDGKYGFIDNKENVVIPFIYSGAKSFKEGLAPVRRNGLYGFINHKGRVVINFKFHDALQFENGFAKIRLNKQNKWGVIDKNGVVIVDCNYKHIDLYTPGKIIVSDGEKYGCLNSDGSIILPMAFDRITLCENYIQVTINESHAEFDYDGLQITPFTTATISSIGLGYRHLS